MRIIYRDNGYVSSLILIKESRDLSNLEQYE